MSAQRPKYRTFGHNLNFNSAKNRQKMSYERGDYESVDERAYLKL